MNKVINTNKLPGAVGPYSQAIKTNGCLFISGCLGIDVSTGNLKEGVEAQARQAMEHVTTLLKEEGLSTRNIVKTTVFLTDLNDFGKVNEIYASYFDKDYYPARSCVEVSKLPKGGLVEVEAIASLD